MNCHFQTLRFLVVGGITAGIYVGGYNYIRAMNEVSPAFASVMAYLLAITFQYIGHARFTFRKSILSTAQVLRFLATNVFGLVFSFVCAHLLVTVLSMPDWIASALIVLALSAINWIVMRHWVFR